MHTAIIEKFYHAALDASKQSIQRLHAIDSAHDFDALSQGFGGDITLSIDKLIEDIYIDAFLPFAAVFSEECGKKGTGEYEVILDPVDGSDNLVSGFCYFASSMALNYRGKTIAAMVVNMVDGSYFYRYQNSPLYRASLLDTALKKVQINSQSLVGIFEKSSLYPKIIDKLIINKLKFRSPGAVALSLALAYHVKYVIFIGCKRTFDVAAGLFLVDDLPRYEDDNTIIIAHSDALLQQIKSIVLEDS